MYSPVLIDLKRAHSDTHLSEPNSIHLYFILVSSEKWVSVLK